MLLQHTKLVSTLLKIVPHIGQPRATHLLLCYHFTAKALSVAVGKLERLMGAEPT